MSEIAARADAILSSNQNTVQEFFNSMQSRDAEIAQLKADLAAARSEAAAAASAQTDAEGERDRFLAYVEQLTAYVQGQAEKLRQAS